MVFLTADIASDFSLIPAIRYSQILKLREINSGDDIINRAIEKFNFSIFLGQNSNTMERVKENPIMTCLRAYRGIKMENATRLSDLHPMVKNDSHS